jgi:prolyl-tRNA synthetase
MLDVYATFSEEFLAIPVIKGVKTPNERFAGADETFCIEGMMQDGKALQMGTSHFLGQNFAKAFDVKFATKEGTQEYVWATSWGVSTRLMGALIMAHSDDDGLVLPPKLAPIQVVIVPIYKGLDELQTISDKILPLVAELRKAGISVKYDDRDTQRSGWKFADYELKGVPVRLAIGPRDLQNNTIELARRDTKEKMTVSFDGLTERITNLLDEIQTGLYERSLNFRSTHLYEVNTWDEFTAALDKGGFVSAHWDGSSETEVKIKEATKATIRCIPLENAQVSGKCILTGNPSSQRVLFARAY